MNVALTHKFDPTILREYDIRGLYGETLNETDARALGRAFGTKVARAGGSRVALCYDGRLSSPALADALGQGLMECGLAVSRIGRGPTPMLYYAVHTTPVDAGIMVTGSHNPPQYNGFKMMLGHASVFGSDIVELGRLAAAGDFVSGKGSAEDHSVFDDYIERLVRDVRSGRTFKVAWDAGNGAAGEAMTALTRKLPGEHILLNEKVDGNFPVHHPDPTVPENLKQLQETVLAEGCDLGFAFDGDGDRIGVVDGEARILWGDQIMVLLAREVLSTHAGAPIIADVKASQILFDEVERMGGRAVMWKTGHSLIKTKMAELKAPLAGEMSAHLFFADRYYGFDDALYAAVRVLDVLSQTEESLADFRDALPAVRNTPEIRFPCPEDRKRPIIEDIKARLQKDGADVIDIDGVRVRDGDGWWLLRASNTQDVLVARCEATSEEELKRLTGRMIHYLEASGLEPPKF